MPAEASAKFHSTCATMILCRLITYRTSAAALRKPTAPPSSASSRLAASSLLPPPKPSLIILNTCTVTNSADQDARAAVRRIQRQNPLAKIIVTGCYAQRAPEEIAALPGVNAGDRQLAQTPTRRNGARQNFAAGKDFLPIRRLLRTENCALRTRFSSPTSLPTPNSSPRRFSNPPAISASTNTIAPAPTSRSRTDAITAARSA